MSKKQRRRTPPPHQAGASFTRSTTGPSAHQRVTDSPPQVSAAQVKLLLDEAVLALVVEDVQRFDDRVVFLAAQCGSPSSRALVVQQVRQGFEHHLADAWATGWQPADVHRVVMRRCDKQTADFAAHAIAEELRRYARDTIDPSWHAQVAALSDDALPAGETIAAHRAAGMSWLTVIEAAVRCLHVLRVLPTVEKIGPIPGQWVRPIGTSDDDPDVDERILTRVRMLLAKAESTPYEAEAETFTAGAASLIARHRISEAMLAAADPDRPRDGASAQRIGIDNPYEQQKVQLLNAVAQANSCQVVWTKEFYFATVVGFPSDLSGVELLYTSLLLQATNAMTATGTRSVQGAHRRSRTFRSSFLTSFAIRIGERLQEAAAAEERSATASSQSATPGARLPALVEREQDVSEATKRLFPKVQASRARRTIDHEGWMHGRRAADDAEVRARSELRRSS